MKIFTTSQIKDLDAKTIKLEGITSSDLMDRAALALFKRIAEEIKPTETILVIAGPGNNGGDALAIARLLIKAGYQVQTIVCNLKTLSNDASIQFDRLQEVPAAQTTCLKQAENLSLFEGYDYIIDGLFGSGLNRPLEGFYAEIVKWMNLQDAVKISIDLPSGLFGEDNRRNIHENMVCADLVLGLQFPRLSFLLAENERLTAQLTASQRREKAAVDDILIASDKGRCAICKHMQNVDICQKWPNRSCFEWRGSQVGEEINE